MPFFEAWLSFSLIWFDSRGAWVRNAGVMSMHVIQCLWNLDKKWCCPQYISFIVLGAWAKTRGVALNTLYLLFLEAGQRTEVLPSIHFIYCSWNLKMLLWSICTQERDVMSDKLESVGGYPMISPTFDSSCTHMILSKFIRISQQVTGNIISMSMMFLRHQYSIASAFFLQEKSFGNGWPKFCESLCSKGYKTLVINGVKCSKIFSCELKRSCLSLNNNWNVSL